MKKINGFGQRGRALAVAGLSLWAMAGVVHAETTDDERPVIKVPRGGGRELFSTYCVLCHKYDGRGGPSEGGYGADLRVTKLSEDEVRQTVTNGRQNTGMPAFKGIIDPDMIDTLARFVKNDLKLKD